jgi:ribonuclease HI
MELTAVIKALQYIQHLNTKASSIKVITDSQYVTGLKARQENFTKQNFITKKGNAISNTSLVKELLVLINSVPLEFIKIKAHQKKTEVMNYNIEADKLSRKLVRVALKEL